MSFEGTRTCDRCETAAPIDDEHDSPEGWGELVSEAVGYDLCRACIEELQRDIPSYVNEEEEDHGSGEFEAGETVNDPSLTRERVYPLAVPETHCAVGQTVEIQVRPQLRFHPQRFIVPSTLAREGYYIEEIVLPDVAPLGPFPAELFSEAAHATYLQPTTVEPLGVITIRIGRREYQPQPFVGVFMGTVEK